MTGKHIRFLVAFIILPLLSVGQLIEAGQEHSIILCGDSTVWTCGQNDNGQLGDGTTIDRTIPVQVPILGIIAVSTGNFHSMALKQDGTVWCWGFNSNGQLGDSSIAQRTNPVQVYGLSNVVAIDAGTFFSMAIRNDGTVWTWGANFFGQLGNGTTISSIIPVQVISISNVVSIAAGGSFGLALDSSGVVWSWGRNASGQLGDSTNTDRSIPVQVHDLPTNVIDLAAGREHSLALGVNGNAWAWGYNVSGQLGDNTTINKSEPIQVISSASFVEIAAGKIHSIGLAVDGTVWTWGYNQYGQLADGGYSQHKLPYQVLNIAGAVAVAGGASHNLVLLSDSTVMAVGYNGFGQLGNSSLSDSVTTPIQMQLTCKLVPPCLNPIVAFNSSDSALTVNFTDLSSGGTSRLWNFGDGDTSSLANPVHTYTSQGDYQVCLYVYNGCSGDTLCDSVTVNCTPTAAYSFSVSKLTVTFTDLSTAATSWSWDFGDANTINLQNPIHTYASEGNYTVCLIVSNGCGQDTTCLNLFVSNSTVTGDFTFEVLAGGQYHTLIRCDDQTVWATGFNNNKQLGDSVVPEIHKPLQTMMISNVVSLAAGQGHSLALMDDGTVWAWGSGYYGQLGDTTSGWGATRAEPKQVPGLNNITSIACGPNHSMALEDNGKVWTWGKNTNGTLGDGTTDHRSYPVLVTGLNDATAIAGGSSFSAAIRSDSTVWAWGMNSTGQLGDSTVSSSTTPIPVMSISKIVKIAAGSVFCIALKVDQTVWAWGHNLYGQLGDNNAGFSNSRAYPLQVNIISGVTDIATGTQHALALLSDSTVWAWGYNYTGQLGDSTSGWGTQKDEPVSVLEINSVISVAAGDNHSLALRSDGTVWGWGNNSSGQLGDTTAISRSIPVQMDLSCYVSIPCPLPESDFSYSDSLLTVTFSDLSSKTTSWLWEFGDGDTSTSQNPIHFYSSAGTYTTCLTSNNNCGEDSTCKQVMVISSVTEAVSTNSLKVYPNVFEQSTIFQLEGDIHETWELVIYDIMGQNVRKISNIRLRQFRFFRDNLPSGMYFYKVRIGLRQLGSGKIVIQ